MPVRSPKFGLTRSGRGWFKRVGGKVRWIVSAKLCPTGERADEFFRLNFADIANDAPLPKSEVTIRQAGTAFVDTKQAKGLHRDTVRDYDDSLLLAMRATGPDKQLANLTATDALAVESAMAHLGTERRLKHVVNLRGFVRWCERQGIPCGWTREMFHPPGKAERRRERAKRRPRAYTPSEIRRLLRHASDRMRAVILLALNCAMGPDELTALAWADVKGGVIDKPRQKTGVEREAPLWPETVAAVALVPKRGPFIFPGPAGKQLDPDRLTRRFHAACTRSCVKPRGLYTLRRTFRTIADAHGDQRAAAKVMGRELPDIDTVYVLTVGRDRIVQMLDHVKSVLRIGRALAARRYRSGQRGLAVRVARRSAAREAAKAKSPKRRGSSASASPPSSRARPRKR